jgi:hypothetical protein
MKHSLIRIAAPAVALTLVFSACSDGTAGVDTAINPELYVAVMGELADLRRFPPEGIGSEDVRVLSDSAREAILKTHGVTAPELLAFARISGSDPARMEMLAAQISAVTDSLAVLRDSAQAEIGTAQPDSAPYAPEITPTTSARPDSPDSLAAARRLRLDSIRSKVNRPSR